MDNYLSTKLKILSFVLMVMVVILHAQLEALSNGFLLFFQRIMTEEVTRIAVPLFFLISGYLFFRNFKRPLRYFFYQKMKKRFRTIFIPFLIFSVIGFLFIRVSLLCFPFLFDGAYANVADFSLVDCLHTIFFQPIGTYHLWFLRDLFILILLSPAIYYVLSFFRGILLIFIFLLWIFGIQYMIAIEAVFFFCLGSYLALYKQKIVSIKRENCILCVTMCIVWLLFCIAIPYFHLSYVFHCLNIIVGIVGVWYLYDCLYERHIKRISHLSLYSFSFFIYLTHEPTLTIIKRSALFVCGHSCLNILSIYIVSPVLTICFSIFIGKYLKKRLPKVYEILTGNR